MSADEITELFDKHRDEYLKFGRIDPKDRRHSRPDLCGMLLLAERNPVGEVKDEDIIGCAEHDEVYFHGTPDSMTEDDVVYLTRCGLRWDRSTGSFCTFT